MASFPKTVIIPNQFLTRKGISQWAFTAFNVEKSTICNMKALTQVRIDSDWMIFPNGGAGSKVVLLFK